ALLRVLNQQRQHVLTILDGLDEAALRRPVLPSGWHSLGIVQHLALDVERFWFRAVLGADPELVELFTGGSAPDSWKPGEELTAPDVFAAYRREPDLADAVITANSPETPLGWWPQEMFGEPHVHDLRDLLLHVIAETACHAGHLDAAREIIDG